MTPLFLFAIGLYALAGVVFIAHLFNGGGAMLRFGRWALGAALLCHLALIGSLCIAQQNPLRDVRGALSLSALLLGLGCFLTTLRLQYGLIGALVSPLAIALLITSRLTPAGSAPPGMERTTTLLGKIHIALAALGVAAFGLAAAMAILYLFQEAALKSKHIGGFYRRTPPLTSLDEAGRRLILVGFPIFTLAVITGLVWVARLKLNEGFRIEHGISGITWLIFAGLIIARVTVGLRGRRAAVLTVLGFAAAVAILLLYMSRRLLGG
jgi:ABC-type uncharacterized transport system permease subunit